MRIFKKISVLFGRSDVVVIDSSVASTIANMQKDLDAYDYAFTTIIGHLRGKFGYGHRPAIAKHLAASKDVDERINMMINAAFELRNEYEKLNEKTI